MRLQAQGGAVLRLIVLVWLIASAAAFAARPVPLTAGTPAEFPRHFTLGWFDDPDATFDAKTALHQSFSPISNQFTLGRRPGVQWFRLDVRNVSDATQHLFLRLSERFYETVDLYTFDRNERLTYRGRSGQTVPRKRRDIDNPAFVFPLAVAPHETVSVLLRIRSTVGTYGAVTLHSRHDLQKTTLFEIALFIFFLGAVFSIMLYVLIFFGMLKEKLYLYFAGYLLLFALIVFAFSGNMGYFFGIESSTRMFAAVPAMTLLFIRISRSLLASARKVPRIDRLLGWMQIVMGVDTLLLLFFPAQSADAVSVTLSLVFPLLSIAGLLIAWRGDRIAWIYFFALSTFMLSITVIFFVSVGIIPFYRREIAYFPLAGALMEFLLIGLAMALRINRLRDERYHLKRILVQTLRHHAQELEATVEKRTMQLSKALKERNTLYRELQHRVKNHFQSILSFVWLQKSHESEAKTAEALAKIHHRIEAMSLLHDQLSADAQTESIDACRYFRALTDNTVRLYGNRNIRLRFECRAPRRIPAKTAGTLAMLLNELVVNAFKHAFLTDENGTVDVVFDATDPAQCRLVVKDDGKGAETIDKGLGWTIIDEMVHDLNAGSIHIEHTPGLHVDVRCRLASG